MEGFLVPSRGLGMWDVEVRAWNRIALLLGRHRACLMDGVQVAGPRSTGDEGWTEESATGDVWFKGKCIRVVTETHPYWVRRRSVVQATLKTVETKVTARKVLLARAWHR
jgi:hypothetical protein